MQIQHRSIPTSSWTKRSPVYRGSFGASGRKRVKFMNHHIQFSAVKKVFGIGSGAVHALGPVDLNVEEGEFISLLGPSGCGKSTLMLMTSGLLEATEGKVVMGGIEVNGPQTDIGVMFQDNTLVPWRTVRGNIELQLEMRGMPLVEHKHKIDQILASVNMEDFKDRYPYELSGGMQQRAAFCQAMIHEPKTMLLDEPLGKLDAMTRERIRSDLQNLWMQKRPTVIFVTHSIEEAIQLSTRVAVITPRPGQIERIIDIDLPFPRDFEVKNSSKFSAYVRETQEIFRSYGVI